MALAINAVLSAGPEDVVYPRFWRGSTVNVRGRVLLDSGDALQGEGVSFLFRLVADRSVQIELTGLWDAAAQIWRCSAELDRTGTWEVRLLCLAPQRQTDWLPLEVVDTPGAGEAPGGGLWVSQQGQAVVTMSGAGLTGVRIAELLEVSDPSDLTLPGVRADGSDARVSWNVIAQGVQDAIAGDVQAVETARQNIDANAQAVETSRAEIETHARTVAEAQQDVTGKVVLADQWAAAANTSRLQAETAQIGAKAAADTTSATVANAAVQRATLADLTTAMAASAEGAQGIVYGLNADEGVYRKAGAALVRVSDTQRQIQAQVAALPLRSLPSRVTRTFSVKDLAGYVAGWMGSDRVWRLEGVRAPSVAGLPFLDAAGTVLLRLRNSVVDLPGNSQTQTSKRAWSVRDATGFLAAWVDQTGALRAGKLSAKLGTLARLTVPHPTAGQPALFDVEGGAVRLAGVRYRPIPDAPGKPAFRLKDERGFVAGYIDRSGVGHGVYAGGSGGSSVVHPPMVLEVISASQMNLHIQGSKGSSRYISFVIKNVPEPAQNSDVWRVHFVHDSTRSNAGAFSLGKQIIIEGEQEFAVKPRGSINFIGGNAHGNEERFSFYAMADGVVVDLTTQATIVCDRFEMFQGSHGFRPGATVATTWAPKGDTVMDIWRRWEFSREDGGARWALSNRVEMKAALSFGGYGDLSGPAYFAMACMARALGDGTVVSNKAAWEPYWQPADVSQDGFTTQTTTQASAIRLWGPNGWALLMRWLKGWDQPDREVYVSSRAGMNKLYHNFFGGTDAAPVTVKAGDVFEGIVEYLFSNSN
jgi:hypothetical protein